MSAESATLLAACIGALATLLAALVPYLVRRARAAADALPRDDSGYRTVLVPGPFGEPEPSAPRTVPSGQRNAHRPAARTVFDVQMGGAECISDLNVTIGVIGWSGGRPYGNVTLPGEKTRQVYLEAGTVIPFSYARHNYTLICTSVHAPNGQIPRLTFEIREVAAA